VLVAVEVDEIETLLYMGADTTTLPKNDFSGPARPLNNVRSAAAARALIAAGADASAVDDYSQAPLKNAADLPPEVTSVLLKAGAPVDAPVDHVGNTALILAASAGNLGVVKLLLAAGANPESRVWSGTALDAARNAREFDQHRLRLLGDVPATRTTFTPDFDGVIAALEKALAAR
jgi:ankyrin repeat protein